MLPRWTLLGWILVSTLWAAPLDAGPVERRLYVAVPGIRNYLEYGGHGILVMDPGQGYRCLRRIPGAGLDPRG
ncbi:MAG: hypothetical protein JNL10_14660, partial [Verrucomicrobiales bacterium]|nr:hypothetical protein [Verrucomicrobiales bacterium]